ncbi:hypothetical protein E2562_000916 [Oryza meyeriana var. granulata]|uniref:F-box domain-containing protein n=1 Tax=Oryza meyeriana var. granulata TaxID=110450 RepID=A0A6G1CXC2_9ORYZ|nr:hypothetical protein E2562_000916 [Oryza meyeriana var. granulata]
MLLVLDTRLMKFSMANLPPDCRRGQTATLEAGEGMNGMFALRGSIALPGSIASDTFDLHYTIRRKEGESRPEQWQMEKIIPLDSGYRYYIRGAMEKHLLLARFPREGIEDVPEEPDLECFSLDVKTSQLERSSDQNPNARTQDRRCQNPRYPFSFVGDGWPPSGVAMASPDQPVPHRLEAPEPPRQLPTLTDELLEEIFLRIGSPADLVRTSAASVSFRCLIFGRPFHRCYRSIHSPLLLGLAIIKSLLLHVQLVS